VLLQTCELQHMHVNTYTHKLISLHPLCVQDVWSMGSDFYRTLGAICLYGMGHLNEVRELICYLFEFWSMGSDFYRTLGAICFYGMGHINEVHVLIFVIFLNPV